MELSERGERGQQLWSWARGTAVMEFGKGTADGVWFSFPGTFLTFCVLAVGIGVELRFVQKAPKLEVFFCAGELMCRAGPPPPSPGWMRVGSSDAPCTKACGISGCPTRNEEESAWALRTPQTPRQPMPTGSSDAPLPQEDECLRALRRCQMPQAASWHAVLHSIDHPHPRHQPEIPPPPQPDEFFIVHLECP